MEQTQRNSSQSERPSYSNSQIWQVLFRRTGVQEESKARNNNEEDKKENEDDDLEMPLRTHFMRQLMNQSGISDNRMQRILNSYFYSRHLRGQMVSSQSPVDESSGLSDQSSDNDSESRNRQLHKITLKQGLPKQWKEIEAEQSEMACKIFKFQHILDEIYEQLGPLALLLFQRIQQLDLVPNFGEVSLNFLKPVLQYYESVAAQAKTNPESASILKSMISIVPSMSQLKKSLKIKESKENIVYKIIFDVLDSYYKNYISPTQIDLKSKFLPLVIYFYSSLSEEEVDEMNSVWVELTGQEPYNVRSRQECLREYEEEWQGLSNSCEGCSVSNFIL